MISQIIIFLILSVILNILLYLSINFNEDISYLILTFLIFLNFINFYLFKRSKDINDSQLKKETTAEDHPIIKAARERLRK